MRPESHARLSTRLSGVSQKAGLTHADIEALEETLEEIRDRHPAEPMRIPPADDNRSVGLAIPRTGATYSHSIVPGGFEVTS